MYKMNFINFVGFAAAVFTTSAFIPQVIKLIKTKKAHDISLLMYSMTTFGIFLWMLYGLMIKSSPVIVANLIAFLLSMTLLMLKIRYK